LEALIGTKLTAIHHCHATLWKPGRTGEKLDQHLRRQESRSHRLHGGSSTPEHELLPVPAESLLGVVKSKQFPLSENNMTVLII